MRYIAILRGINVGGQRRILMADLTKLFGNLGFDEVTTYIQSGNVVFSSGLKMTSGAIAIMIEKEIRTQFGFEVPVIVRTIEEMVTTIGRNPFMKFPGIETDKLHVTFLLDFPLTANVQKLTGLDFAPDQFRIIENDVYLYCPDSYGNTKISNKFLESKLKVTATTRNWATVVKLSEIASDIC